MESNPRLAFEGSLAMECNRGFDTADPAFYGCLLVCSCRALLDEANSPGAVSSCLRLLDGSTALGKARKEDGDQCLRVCVDPLRVAGIPAREKSYFRSSDVGLRCSADE